MAIVDYAGPSFQRLSATGALVPEGFLAALIDLSTFVVS